MSLESPWRGFPFALCPGESLERVLSLESPWREFRPWRVPGEGSVPGESLERVPSLESPWREFRPWREFIRLTLREGWRLLGDVIMFSFFKSKI